MSTNRNIKLLHPAAKIPTRNHPLDAGHDCYLVEDIILEPHSSYRVPLGFAIQIKQNQMLTVRSRSSTKVKGVSCTQTTCDAGYTGQISAFLINHSSQRVIFKKGDRVVQLVFIRLSGVNTITEGILPESSRGSKGFGSSGQ